jgi:hypothetical protein
VDDVQIDIDTSGRIVADIRYYLVATTDTTVRPIDSCTDDMSSMIDAKISTASRHHPVVVLQQNL